jgi:uncharacterized repeat protein (TIGR01451 family)
MIYYRRSLRWSLFFSLAVFLLDVQGVFALGTTAGTSVGNQATVNFKVGGVVQPPASNATTTFLVDRKINLTVAQVGGSVSVAPGSNDQVMAFTVTNSSNAPLDFSLAATNGGAVDQFDPTNIRVFVDVNTNGTYEVATDTALFLDEIPADATRTVFVVSNIPAGQANSNTAAVTLTATSREPGVASTQGALVTQTAGADTAGVDTVFADLAGTADGARDGQHGSFNTYTVATAGITVTKTVIVISDPFNGTSTPKAIPGALIEYCIQIANPAGGATATEVTVSDPVPLNTTFSSGTIVAGGTVTGAVCNADGTDEDDNATGADESDPNGGNITGTTVTTTVPSVPAGTTVTSRFRVTIN